ncbi:MAG: DUF4254 domain-containing protein [Spirochaetes bacterium]|nr:DUF4254 domain-containing protein [Spirochaetota bacterium]
MFPESQLIMNISNNILSQWHNSIEKSITYFNDALNLINNYKKDNISDQIALLSLINTTLWHEEDKARDTSAKDKDIADVKRNIDKLNAMRVNKTEEIDNILFNETTFNRNSPLNTETVGSVIDRLTILALKKYHMEIESKRQDSSEEIRNKCISNLSNINTQMKDLMLAYDTLLSEIQSGKRRYSLYRQFKMYNDPDLNPVLYSAKQQNK